MITVIILAKNHRYVTRSIEITGWQGHRSGARIYFEKLTHIRTDFKKTIGRKDGFYLISGEIGEITGHYDPQKLILVEKIRFCL